MEKNVNEVSEIKSNENQLNTSENIEVKKENIPMEENNNSNNPEGEENEEEDEMEEEDSDEDLDIKLLSPEEMAKKSPSFPSKQGRTFTFPKNANQSQQQQSQLPSPMISEQQKSAFDIPIDDMEEKPWRKPGADITDYFNYGFNEETWKSYCQKQVSLRLEQSMQGKIKVYESKSSDGKIDLPPELAAMVAGDTSEISTDNSSYESSMQHQQSSRMTTQKRTPYSQQISRMEAQDWNRPTNIDRRRHIREQDDSVIQVLANGDQGGPSTPTGEPYDKEEDQYSYGMPPEMGHFPPPGYGYPPPPPMGRMPPRSSYHSRYDESPGEDRGNYYRDDRRSRDEYSSRYERREHSSKDDRRSSRSRDDSYHKRSHKEGSKRDDFDDRSAKRSSR